MTNEEFVTSISRLYSRSELEVIKKLFADVVDLKTQVAKHEKTIQFLLDIEEG